MTTDNYKHIEIDQVHALDSSNYVDTSALNYNAVHLAYNISKIIEQPLNNQNEEYLTALPGWQLAYNSLISKETSAYNLKAVVFVNNSTKALHFAFAGTDPSSYYDLLDDFYIYLHKMINKFDPMKALIDEVDKAIGVEKAENYSISSSGHSLGGVVSELFAAEMLSRGRNFTKSTTFDNPGSKPLVEEALQNNLLTGSGELCIDDIAKHCEVFLAPKNLINSTNPQLANEVKLSLPNNIEQNEHEYSKLGWTSFLYDMLGTAYSTAANFLNISKDIHNLIDGLNGHKLSNFADYKDCSFKVSQWIEYDKKSGYYNPTPIILEEDNPGLASKLKDTQHSVKKDVLFEYQEDDYVKIDWIAYSQLNEVQSVQSAKENNQCSTEYENEWEDLSDDGYYSGDESNCQEHIAEPNIQELAGQLPEEIDTSTM